MMDKPTDWRSGTRRIFSNEFKLHMVELASKPNANVAQLAREHGVDNNLIFKWLRLWQRAVSYTQIPTRGFVMSVRLL
ncbi:TPA: transposase [Escherichia coli]|nr:transposase [Escherichia coli]HAJ7165264.1 transposase [Escherichia coli]HAJ7170470.1 transposase [Escherichia coli]HAJ7199692.1 transposase [Escherichia coli]